MKDLNLIELTDLEKRYGKKEALTGINLTIGRGKTYEMNLEIIDKLEIMQRIQKKLLKILMQRILKNRKYQQVIK